MRRVNVWFAQVVMTLSFAGVVAAPAQAGPVVSLSPTSVDFGNQLLGTVSQTKSITLTNTGDAALHITLIKPSPAGTYAVFSDCGGTVAPGGSCTIRVMFSPTKSGLVNGNVSIQDNAPGSPQKVSLKGVGAAPPVILTPTSLEFGTLTVGTISSPQTTTLTNQAAGLLTIGSISTTSSEFTSTNNCPTNLNTGGSCEITVRFAPTSPGPQVATLNVSSSDPSSPQLVHLGGAATSGSGSLSPTTLTFTSQRVGTTSVPKDITLTNNGSTDLDIISILASGDYAQTNTCGGSLASGTSCVITVTFAPSERGTRRGFITISDSGAGNLRTATLTGTGFVRSSALTVSPKVASVTFTQTQQFQAFLNGTPTSDVTWSVDNIVGGNGGVGTITTSGLYTPPQVAGPHTIKSASNADPRQTALVPMVVTNLAGVFTYHNDNARTGQNLQETVLTTGNVNKNQFGKLFSYPVDGETRVTPLYVANVQISEQEFRNVVYVATEHDSVYAFDADGRKSTPLWHVSFIDPPNGIITVPAADVNVACPGVGAEFGVSATPVVDPATNRLFVLARTKDISGPTPVFHQKLHALDLATGAELPGSPVEIQASVPGIGEGSQQGTLAFDSLKEHSRVALTLSNGVVYLAWASVCDNHPYHGWIIGYDANSLQQVAVYNASPNGQAAGVWHSGSGLAVDAEGSLYFETSNGLFTVDGGGSEYGQSIVKLSTSGGTLAVDDYFTPFDATFLTQIDSDLSAFGVMLLPDQPTPPTRLLIGGNKKYGLYVLDRDNMGQFKPTDNNRALQSIAVTGGCPLEAGYIFGVTAYWQQQVYVWPCGIGLQAYRSYKSLLSPSPLAVGPLAGAYPPPFPSVTANGNSQGIVWGINEHNWVTRGPAILYAFDAANVSRLLYTSLQVSSRDRAGVASKGPTPTIANGKVYVATATELNVYGLLP